jgi:hypothetical protein
MKVSRRLPALGVLDFFALGALTFLSAPIASLTPAIAQQQSTNATSPELAPEGEAAMTEEHTHEASSNETATDTFTVRDSVFALLTDQTIPSNGFIHLYDTTPYSIRDGHVAAKIPCDDESAPLLNILVGVAPNLAPAPIELVPTLSTPGELCLYHTDLPGQVNATTSTNATTANATMITDIAISNPGDEDVTLPSTSTVVIGINEITKGAHSHEEEEEEQAQDGAP